MKITNRKTSWGRMVTAEQGGQVVAELMHFDEPGSFHTHGRTEHVRCVAGSGVVESKIDSETRPFSHRCPRDSASSNQSDVVVPPGHSHRMVPGPDGMTCLIWYSGGDR